MRLTRLERLNDKFYDFNGTRRGAGPRGLYGTERTTKKRTDANGKENKVGGARRDFGHGLGSVRCTGRSKENGAEDVTRTGGRGRGTAPTEGGYQGHA